MLLVIQPRVYEDRKNNDKGLFQFVEVEDGPVTGLNVFNTYAMSVICQLGANGLDIQIT